MIESVLPRRCITMPAAAPFLRGHVSDVCAPITMRSQSVRPRHPHSYSCGHGDREFLAMLPEESREKARERTTQSRTADPANYFRVAQQLDDKLKKHPMAASNFFSLPPDRNGAAKICCSRFVSSPMGADSASKFMCWRPSISALIFFVLTAERRGMAR